MSSAIHRRHPLRKWSVKWSTEPTSHPPQTPGNKHVALGCTSSAERCSHDCSREDSLDVSAEDDRMTTGKCRGHGEGESTRAEMAL
jgi:hypothetical protein